MNNYEIIAKSAEDKKTKISKLDQEKAKVREEEADKWQGIIQHYMQEAVKLEKAKWKGLAEKDQVLLNDIKIRDEYWRKKIEEVVERLEELRKEQKEFTGSEFECVRDWKNQGFNQALDQATNIIKELIK